MTKFRKTCLSVLISVGVVCGLEVAQQLSVPGVHSLISTADAIVGRPLSPVSVAGVARRSVARCAAGMVC